MYKFHISYKFNLSLKFETKNVIYNTVTKKKKWLSKIVFIVIGVNYVHNMQASTESFLFTGNDKFFFNIQWLSFFFFTLKNTTEYTYRKPVKRRYQNINELWMHKAQYKRSEEVNRGILGGLARLFIWIKSVTHRW